MARPRPRPGCIAASDELPRSNGSKILLDILRRNADAGIDDVHKGHLAAIPRRSVSRRPCGYS